ncbi:MAG: hypothetical protein R3F43_26080 [bacterium]
MNVSAVEKRAAPPPRPPSGSQNLRESEIARLLARGRAARAERPGASAPETSPRRAG